MHICHVITRLIIGGAQETGNQIADNGQAGIFITGTVHANITFNTIWNNTHNGVAVSDNTSFQDEISMNSIYQNGWLGISLGGTNTPTPNDGNNNNPNKPNRGFNYPEFSAATFPLVGGDVAVSGTAPADSEVEVFATGPQPDPSGHGQGTTVLVTIPVGAAGTFSANLTGLSVGDSISATATSTAEAPCGAGNTSEFSGNARVIEGPTKPVVTAINPPTGQPGARVTVTGSNFGPTQGNSTITIGGVPATVLSWSDTKIVVTIGAGATSGAVVVTTAQGGSNDNKTFTLVYPTWYLAEGTTAWGFNTYITIENPNPTAVTARIQYMDPQPEASGMGRVYPPRTITLPAASQTTVDPRWDLGNTDFCTKVTCLQGKTIAVDRTMFWTGKGAASPEAHSSVGVTLPSTGWYLPEGCSDFGFETWTLIENPGPATAHLQLTYMTETAGPKTIAKTVPAHSRATYNMEQDIGKASASVEVASDEPVIAERSMYRNNRREGSCSIGTTAAANDFYLAEGSTAWGFTTYLLIQNPNDKPADVTVFYLTPKGPVQEPPFKMPANSRKTIKVNDVKGLSNTDTSIQVYSPQRIIAERSMYWDNGTGEACHDSIGLSAPHRAFMLPDGQTSAGWDTYTLVQNPNETDVSIKVTYLPQGGGKAISFTDNLPADTRRTYNMADKIKSGRASVLVQVTDPSGKVIVERSMYLNNKGAGTDTIGAFSD